MTKKTQFRDAYVAHEGAKLKLAIYDLANTAGFNSTGTHLYPGGRAS